MPDTLPTAAERAAKVAAETKAIEAEVKAKVAAVPGPFNLTTDDKFILKDSNSDGLFDTIVVERVDRVVVAKAQVLAERYAGYFAALASAEAAAAEANRGRSALEVQAAINVAVAKAKADWKGPVPPPTEEEVKKAEAEKAEVARQAAVAAEVTRLNRLR